MAESSAKLIFIESKGKGLNSKFKKSKSIMVDSETFMPDWITVTISIREYRNILSTYRTYTTGDIQAICEFDGTVIGETCSLALTVNNTIESKDSFTFRINKKCPKDIDKLLSLPAILTVHQLTGDMFNYDLHEQLMCNLATPVKPVESLCGIYEAVVDEKMRFFLDDRAAVKREKSLKKAAKKNISLIEDVKSETSNTGSLRSKSKSTKPMSIVYGMSVIDFLPLFRGRRKFTETLPIKPLERFEDDRMATYKCIPMVVIDVSIDQSLNYDQSTIGHFTLESIYNLPPSIAEEMTCTVATHFPSFDNSVCGPILFKNAVLTNEEHPNQFKCWPNMPPQGTNANTTKYGLNPDMPDQLCELTTDFDQCMQSGTPRLVFNMIKRVLMDAYAVDKLRSQGETFKHLLMELHFAEKGSHGVKSLRTPSKSKKDICDLHCMALVKMSSLILPGETKLRIAVPIKTFSIDEVKTSVGISSPMFASLLKKKQLIKYSKHHSSKEFMKDKEKEKYVKVNRSSQTTRSDAKLDWRRRVSQLTLHSGVELFNEASLPTFAIVEIELTKPIIPKLNAESLSNCLEMLLIPSNSVQDKEESSMTHICKKLTRGLSDQEKGMQFHATYSKSIGNFGKIISKVALDLQGKFARYLDEITDSRDYSFFHCSHFFEFLDKIGAYNRYDSTIRDALSMMTYTTSSPRQSCACSICRVSYSEVNKFDLMFKNTSMALHGIVNQLKGVEMKKNRDSYLFAKEALEMGMTLNGERIMLERMCTDDENADYWFDYAIFLIETNQLKRAMECVHEGVVRNPDHKYCLLMYGMLLEEQNRRSDAETVLLTVVTKEPAWFEGWGILYLFYKRHTDDADMQRAFEQARKCMDVSTGDGFFHFEDLTYGSIDTQQSVPSRLVRFLIKVRMFSWAEMYMASTQERFALNLAYLSAVISYYKRDYENCIKGLEELKDMLEGQKTSIIALQAHCLANLGDNDAALIYYRAILENSYIHSRCHLMRLITLKCAKVLIENPSYGNLIEARNILFTFCKYELSPLAWMLLGCTYYKENYFRRSTYCFRAGILLDYGNGDIWALLALANIKLRFYRKAIVFVYQAMKYHFDYHEYGMELEKEMKAMYRKDDERSCK